MQQEAIYVAHDQGGWPGARIIETGLLQGRLVSGVHTGLIMSMNMTEERTSTARGRATGLQR